MKWAYDHIGPFTAELHDGIGVVYDSEGSTVFCLPDTTQVPLDREDLLQEEEWEHLALANQIAQAMNDVDEVARLRARVNELLDTTNRYQERYRAAERKLKERDRVDERLEKLERQMKIVGWG